MRKEFMNIENIDLNRLLELITALEAAKASKEERDTINTMLIDFFRETGLKSYKTDDLIIRFVDERETNQFDVDMLKDKYPDIWEECHSPKIRPPHISIKKIE